jgi:hypothetical protein
MEQLKTIDEYMLRQTQQISSYIFFRKFQADIYRYMAEVSKGANYEYVKQADNIYIECDKLYKMLINLRIQRSGSNNIIDAVRLSLYFNYAVFMADFLDQKREALRMLLTEIQDALDDFDKWNPSDEDKIAQQVELMQEQVNVWKIEVEEDSEEEN